MGNQQMSLDQVRQAAQDMRGFGENISSEIQNVYNLVMSMHGNMWKGNIYAKLVNSFNNVINGMNNTIKTVVDDYPRALEQIVSIKSQADDRGGTPVGAEQARTIKNLEAINDGEDFKYNPDDVAAVKGQIMTSLNNVTAILNSIYIKVSTLVEGQVWVGQDAAAYLNSANKMKTDFTNSFNEFAKDFDECMKAAYERYANAERNATVNN